MKIKILIVEVMDLVINFKSNWMGQIYIINHNPGLSNVNLICKRLYCAIYRKKIIDLLCLIFSGKCMKVTGGSTEHSSSFMLLVQWKNFNSTDNLRIFKPKLKFWNLMMSHKQKYCNVQRFNLLLNYFL